jgi:hypothetical protein
MGLRERLGGGWRWILNVEVLRDDGVLVRLLGRMEWVSGRILCGFRRSFVVTPNLRWEITKVRFWHDCWCGDMALKEAYLVLCSIACAKYALIAAYVEFSGGAI